MKLSIFKSLQVLLQLLRIIQRDTMYSYLVSAMVGNILQNYQDIDIDTIKKQQFQQWGSLLLSFTATPTFLPPQHL